MIVVDEHLTFAETTHTYYLDGQEVMGPTSVISSLAITNFDRVSLDILERAQAFGDFLHKATNYLDQGILDWESVAPELEPYLRQWEKFRESNVQKFLAIEKPVYSRRFKFAGTLDRVFINQSGKVALLDIKSALNPHPGTALQTAAYQIAWEEMGGEKIKERMAIHIRPDGVRKEPYSDRGDKDMFLMALAVAKWKRTKKLK